MNIKNFDLNLLVVFQALFEEKNVTKASKKVGITQPAMSNALNRLRYLVNDELFIRGPKGMRPTPRANELSLPINSALNNLELSLSSINFNPLTTKKNYRISMSDDVAPLLIPNISKFLETKSPNSSLQISHEQGFDALNLLDNNEIDFAVGRFETIPKRFSSKILFSEKYVCIVRNTHKFAKEKKLSIKQYLESRHLRVAPSNATVSPIDRALGQIELERRVFIRIDLITLAPLFIKNTDLVLTLPSVTAERMAKSYGFTILYLPIDLDLRHTKLVWHAELTNHPAFDWIKEQIKID